MGKPAGKKKNQEAQKSINVTARPSKSSDRSSKAIDEDTAIFISMSQEIKEEGNKLLQKHDREGAMLKYEKAIKLLPQNHIDIAYLHTSMAECYMQLGLGEYPRAINECNLALEVSPKYSKALLKRARCYEALNRLNLAYRDVNIVLGMEPKNLMALEIVERLRKVMAERGIEVDNLEVDFGDPEARKGLRFGKTLKDKTKKKKGTKNGDKIPQDKVGVAEKFSVVNDKEVTKTVEGEKLVMEVVKEEKVVMKTVKLAFGDDIRMTQLPMNCSIELVREVVRDRFPGLKGVLVKYSDQEGDLVTITTTDELRLAEKVGDPQGSLKLYVVEGSPDQELAYREMNNEAQLPYFDIRSTDVESGIGRMGKEAEKKKVSCPKDWLVQFARIFKNHVGFDSDPFLDLHEIGMKLQSEAMEDVVTSDEAQELFQIASGQFQEMAALALFNWGNIHMSKARKRVAFSEDESQESILEKIKIAYEWALKEYAKAGVRYEEAMKIKPDFYEGLLAHGQQLFEQAKLCWNHAVASKNVVDSSLESGPSSLVLQLYNKAEDNMERGVQMWEEMEEQRLNGLCKSDKYKAQLQKMGLDGLFEDVSTDEAAERAAHMRSQIYFMWGSLLYERSVVEYKLGLPTWEECLEVAVEKFEFAGASPTDIAIMIKNHCSNEAALEGVGFKIDELVAAWNEMYDAKRWEVCVPAFRLEPLFRRRAPSLHFILENL